MATTVLPLLPKDMPCDAPTSFFVSCIAPYIPPFALAGGNSAGMGECNKTVRRAASSIGPASGGRSAHMPRHPQEVAERVLPGLHCAGTQPDLRKVVDSLSTVAFAESGGRSVVLNPQQYGLKTPQP